jgi:colanic acid biosynthesis glycosyl transferase WcaI
MMRVIVWGINYAPEVTGIAPQNVALCEFLREQGVEVEMVTTFAYYPAWRKSPEDRHLLFRKDVINGVPVHRCWHFVPESVAPWKRILHEATFVLTSTLRVFFLKRADVYVVVSPPLLLGLASAFVTVWKRASSIFHVQDLQPDAAVGLGMLRPGWFTRALYWLERCAYANATRVSGISEEMLDAFRSKGVPEQKLILFPNGVAMPDESQIPARGAFRAKQGYGADELLAVYAGNLGVKQGLDVLLDAADKLRGETKIRIVLCGDGAERAALAQEIADRALTNVSMLPLQTDLAYREMLVDADVSLITQQRGSGNAFFPSKLLVTLAYGSPAVTVADKESALARTVATGGFGRNIEPERPDDLANSFRELAQDRQLLQQWSENGREYVKKFEQRKLLADFFEELKRVHVGGTRSVASH